MGARYEKWVVGRDVGIDTYKNFVDPVTKELYALVHFENGAPVTSLLKKEIYEIAMAKIGESLSEDDLESIADKVINDLRWGSSQG